MNPEIETEIATENTLSVCVYHRDADGCCAAAIVNRRYPGISLIGLQYGETIPWDKLTGQNVVMVDFSFQPWTEMLRLMREAKHLVWLDHHKTALEEARNYVQDKGVNTINFEKRLRFLDTRMEVVLEDGRAGCELTWEYFFPGRLEPLIVHHIGRYDVWDHKEADTKYVRAGLLIRDIDPHAYWWQWVLASEYFSDDHNPSFKSIVSDGMVIRKFQSAEWERACKNIRIVQVNPQRCGWTGIGRDSGPIRIALLNARGNFDVFESLDPTSFDIGALFSWTGHHWSISLYTHTEDIDVGAFAKLHGGGGHRKAAGFQTPKLPDWLFPSALYDRKE